MTDARKIQMLKAMQEETDENTLSTFLYIAKAKILTHMYPFGEVDVDDIALPSKYDSLQLEIASYLLNKRGGEGEVQHTENGITRTWENADVPMSMLRQIMPMASIVGGTYESNE